ncbi:inositol monophosphatase family protein [Nanoarchaeota archaeon]
MSYKNVGIRAAKEAGQLIMKEFRKEKSYKSKSVDQNVTEVDFKSQKRIISVISKKYPDHDIIAEEKYHKKSKSKYEWIIDPIDGTDNYIYGLPHFCVSIALAHEGGVILGIVYNPVIKELFTAEKGKGAYFNGKKIHVNKGKQYPQPLILFDASLHFMTDKKLKGLRALAKKGFYIRTKGSCALDMCYIAKGYVQGKVAYNIKAWDIAAAGLIIEEAGGKVTDHNGEPWSTKSTRIIASNRFLHDTIIKSVSKS